MRSHCGLVAAVVVVVTADGGTVMEARGKECDVAVQHEAPEYLACLDLDLSGSIVQQIKRPDLPDTINVQCAAQFQGYWRVGAFRRSKFCISDCENIL